LGVTDAEPRRPRSDEIVSRLIKLTEEAAQAEIGDKRVSALTSLAHVYVQAGRTDEALGLGRSLQNPVALAQIGASPERAGKTREATWSFSEAESAVGLIASDRSDITLNGLVGQLASVRRMDQARAQVNRISKYYAKVSLSALRTEAAREKHKQAYELYKDRAFVLATVAGTLADAVAQ
jgi:hypothetical protein